MAKTHLISVIIPFYNDELYIQQCLTAIINQTFTDLEIILVDDGSTDHSLSIVQKYQALDNRIKVIHEANQGQGAARNNGIRHAHGDYIAFIDADDYVTNDYLEFLYNLLVSHNFQSPLAICSYYELNLETNQTINRGNDQRLTLSGEKCLEMMCYDEQVNTCAYTKLIHRDLLDDHFFPERVIYEDLGAIYKLFIRAKRVECGFSPRYIYQVHPNSTLSKQFDEHKLASLTMVEQMINGVLAIYPNLKKATDAARMSIYLALVNQLVNSNEQKRLLRIISNDVKQHMYEVLMNHKYPLKKKLSIILLCMGSSIYGLSLKIFSKVTGKHI